MRNHFKKYQSKPIERLSYQIEEHDTFRQIENDKWELMIRGGPRIFFKAHEQVFHGDWVIYLTETDTYHCADNVFRERNIVEG